LTDSAQTTITVIGTGYVGLTTAVLFAQAGFKTYALDINQERLSAIRSGKSFFYEEGLDPLIKESIGSGLLIPIGSYASSISQSQFVFSCVGTPDNSDGSTNLDFIFQAAEAAAEHMNNRTTYIQKSTVPVGTGKRIEELLRESGTEITYLSNPEFLREGTALIDSLSNDRIVIGGDNSTAIDKLSGLYKAVFKKRSDISRLAGISLGQGKPEYIEMTLESAELTKVTANAFLALKISFSNSIAKLADRTHADIVEVMNAVGADKRIGRAFLNAGRGYGGGCFPKDVSGLIRSADDQGIDLTIMRAARDVNDSMPAYIADKLQDKLGSLKGFTVGVLGLSFKAGTSDARKSPGVSLSNILSQAGATVRVYDPQANEEARDDLQDNIVIAESIEDVLKDCDVVCIATDWPEFINYSLDSYAQRLRKKLFVDCMNAFNIRQVELAGMKYIGVGRG